MQLLRNLLFSKYPQICALEAHHDVDVGKAYTNEIACKTFCHYIAESRREDLSKCLSRAKFFSLLMDSSTDSGNVDDELFLLLRCDMDGSDEMVHSRMSYFTVARPKTVTGRGLVECMQGALSRLGIVEINSETCKSLVGIRDRGSDLYVGMRVVKMFCMYKRYTSKNLKTRSKSPKKEIAVVIPSITLQSDFC